MKSIIVFALIVHLVEYGSATECYNCVPSKDNGYCRTVDETTPITDAKNSMGCYKITGEVQLGEEKNEMVNILFSATPGYDTADCDAVLENSENRYRVKDATCTSCNSNLCNSSPGIQATFVTVLVTVLCFFYRN